MVADFEKYRRRAERFKRLEAVFESARRLFDVAQSGKPTEAVWEAMAKLKEAVGRVEQLPPEQKS